MSFFSLIFLICVTTLTAQTETQYADAWSDPNPPNWTPAPPDMQVLGPPDAFCTGTSNAGTVSAIFEFPTFSPTGPITGIEVLVNYRSVVACVLQLTNSGSLVGATRTLDATSGGASTCDGSILKTAGGAADLWGGGVSMADFTAGTVGVKLSRTTGPDEPRSLDIESVGLKIFFGNMDPVCSGASIMTQEANSQCKAIISGSDVSGITDPDGDMLTITVSPTELMLGSNQVTVMADDGNGGTCSIMITVNVVDNTDPVISCPTMVVVDNDAGECSAVVDFSVTATDNCGATVMCTPASGSTFPVGSTMVSCTATDAAGNTDECSFQVVVEDTEDPTIDCSGIDPNRNTDPGVCSFTMPGTGFDPAFDDNCPGSSVENDYNSSSTLMGATFPEGTTQVVWTASDAAGNMAQCTIDIVITDNEPPVITTISDRISLWPPNHSYATIDAADCVVAVTDNCDMSLTADDVFITYVTSDEPEDVSDPGDGTTLDDIVISDNCSSVDLRKERQGGGNGRVYTIHMAVTDENGNTGTASCQVQVRHDKNGPDAVDDGVAYTSFGPCALGMPRIGHPDLTGAPIAEIIGNYPNPFRSSTEFIFELHEDDRIEFSIYDLQGQLVEKLHSGFLHSGTHKLRWDTNDRALPGVYIYHMTGRGTSTTGKIMYAPY